ncbi:MAG: PLP-dependent aminotransferase family protein [Clostridia bacterium]|nr:PLP-dependent aminotransferase family protein [Clostridia bacterium]
MENLSSGNNNIINEKKIKESIQRVINTKKYNHYASPKGIKELRIEISKLINKLWNFKISASNILITTGSQQSINLVSDILLHQGDTILIEQPTYSGTIKIFRNKSIHMIGINISEDGIDIQALKKAIIQNDPKLIYVVPTFNNPTGYAWEYENRLAFLSIINQYHITVIEDDPYSMLNFTNQKYDSLYKLNNGKNIIYLGTFSKLISPSINVGYIIAESSVINELYQYKESYDLCTSLFNQYVILDYLENNDLQAEINLKIAKYQQLLKNTEYDLKNKYKDNIIIHHPKGGIFLFIKFLNIPIPPTFENGSNYFISKIDNHYSRVNICCLNDS